MTTVRIVEFHPSHVEVMELQEQERKTWELEDARKRSEILSQESTATGTLLCDGRIVCCAGFRVIWPGVAEGWLLPSIYVQKYPILVTKTFRGYISSIMETFGLHRFQVTAYDNYRSKWLEHLGFQREGVMRMATDDKQDQVLYARVVE